MDRSVMERATGRRARTWRGEEGDVVRAGRPDDRASCGFGRSRITENMANKQPMLTVAPSMENSDAL